MTHLLVSTILLIAGIYFIATAFLKILSPGLFLEHLLKLKLFPEKLVPLLKTLIPLLGFILGFSLLLRTNLPVIILLAVLYMLIGGFITFWGVSKKLVDDCGCYGPLQFIPPPGIPDNAFDIVGRVDLGRWIFQIAVQ